MQNSLKIFSLNLKLLSSSLLLGASLVFANPIPSPAQKALQIAQAQPHVRSLALKLKNEAKSIQDTKMREDALSVIETPSFKFLKALDPQEMQSVLKKLKQESLLDPKTDSLLAQGVTEAMRFIAAPGSSWSSHHAYPAGLLYHTYANLRIGVKYAEVYKEIYGVHLKRDLIRFAAIWHDAAKTLTIPWNPDGSCIQNEVQVGGTAAHHIFGIAEAAYRKHPPSTIITLASAHSPPSLGKPPAELLNYLKAAAILAKVSYSAVGVTEDGKALAENPPIEAWINHLGDHDYVLMGASMGVGAKRVDLNNNQKNDPKDYWKRNETLSQKGDLRFYEN